jgi:hypothetical protein
VAVKQTCAEPGCDAVLSQYNPADRCAVHDVEVSTAADWNRLSSGRGRGGMRDEAQRRGVSLYTVRKERFEAGLAKSPTGGDTL